MTNFYVLPPRTAFGQYLLGHLGQLFPGHDLSEVDPLTLAETVVQLLGEPTADFLIFRDDLPEEQDLASALRDAFGAEESDIVTEVSLESFLAKRWPMNRAA